MEGSDLSQEDWEWLENMPSVLSDEQLAEAEREFADIEKRLQQELDRQLKEKERAPKDVVEVDKVGDELAAGEEPLIEVDDYLRINLDDLPPIEPHTTGITDDAVGMN